MGWWCARYTDVTTAYTYLISKDDTDEVYGELR